MFALLTDIVIAVVVVVVKEVSKEIGEGQLL